MQTSDRLIAYQLFSLEGYHRLRKALMQQGYLFELVVTENDLADNDLAQRTHWISSIAQFLQTANLQTANTRASRSPSSHHHAAQSTAASSANAVHADTHRKPSAQQRSARSNPRIAKPSSQTPGTGSRQRAAKSEQLDQFQIATQSLHQLGGVSQPPSSSIPQGVRNLDARQHDLAWQGERPGEHRNSAAGTVPCHDFVLMSSPTLSVLLTADPVSGEAALAEYQVGLTFDDGAIAAFLEHLAQPVQPNVFKVVVGDSHDKMAAPKVSVNDKVMAQKSFVLSWAKHLATSPDNDPQPTQATLDNQLEQSLLLDQVITRIRHSLDLPAILETTVAQVREFLSADRLVLYQFDQFEPVAVPPTSPPTSGPSESGAMSAHSPQFAKQVHSGHVTYESRVSEALPSVLNFAEKECFEPSRLMRDRYLAGKPIAIDNVDQQYAKVKCLLAFLHRGQVKSKIIAPIIVQKRLWGLLIAHQCDDYRHWEKTEVVFLQHIAEHLAVAISQASLYQQVRDQTQSLESCVIERTQNLHDALMAAESANITKGEFLSTMSHELRTPLTYIIGMSATLLRWSLGVLNERQRSYLSTINQSGEQLLGIINNILEFANVESGRSLLDFSEFSLRQMVNTIIDEYQEMADKQDVTLVCDFRVPSAQDDFRADIKRLGQILSNLMDNAIKFTPAGGKVSLNVWREAHTAVFQLEDSGIGIPDSQQTVLFEKFKQLESPFQRQYSGTGLGLAMTKRLVELHGGSIHVDSQVGKGSTFSVRLPAQPDADSPQHYQVPAALESSADRVILLETDEDNAAIVCEMLTAAGYEVIWLVDSDQLAAQLDGLRPVMLVADLALLSQNLEEVKAVQLSITALNTKVLALMGLEDGVPSPMAHHDILRKPIDPKVLLEKVRQLTMKRA